MRPEISNELLLQVIQAWDPAEAGDWFVDDENELRWGENEWYIRWPDGQVYCYGARSSYRKACKLVEFLLKDRPDLGLLDHRRCWKDGVPTYECEKATNVSWDSDPWGSTSRAKNLVKRIKSYEYLKEWKESQESTAKVCQADAIQVRLDRGETIQGECLYLEKPIHLYSNSIVHGCEIECKLDSWWEWKEESRCQQENVDFKDPSYLEAVSCREPEESGVEFRQRLRDANPSPEVPAIYDRICPHCNGSKEVVGWYGKESCNVC